MRRRRQHGAQVEKNKVFLSVIPLSVHRDELK
jgi:hypothetical protein